MKLHGLLLGAAAAVFLPVSAQAAATEGFYVGAGAGVNWTQESDLRDYPTVGSGLTEKFKLGGVGSLSGGYATAMGLRTELEFAWRWRNSVKETDSASPALRDLGGKTSSIAFMGNLLYDMDTGSPVTPYVGIGAGVAQVRKTLRGVTDEDWKFAYQGIVGAAYRMTDKVALTLDYRYFATVDPKFDLGPVTSKGEYSNHSFMVGVRYSFGGPAATPVAAAVPPAPAVQQQPQTEYLVFFDWDKANITPVSDKVIGDAATAAGRLRTVGIHVVGHTDTSGSPTYNQRLSLRRAEAVRQALIGKGVTAGQISVEGKGETQLMVPTGQNVREPSNRRAQILIRVQ